MTIVPYVERMRSGAAGVTLALVGFASSFAVVLQGLRAVGASPAEAASGLVALCVAQALGMLVLTYRYRLPLTLAWSTPGAALLASTGAVAGGWPAAVGAFLLVGVLIVLTALWPALGRLVALIPTPVAQAMLAGVLLSLCSVPFRALVAQPLYVAPLVALWAIAVKWRPLWAAPLAFLAAIGIIAARADWGSMQVGDLAPVVYLVTPQFSVAAVVGLAVPLYLVTMASQNVPGAAVMASFGYRVPWRASLGVTGLGTMLASVAGGHAVNLAAITAALAAGPEADPDPRQRWRASAAAAWTYLALAVLAPGIAIIATRTDPLLLGAVAGLALLGTMATSLSASVADESSRLPAAITFVVAASGVTVLGVGSPFWALLAGSAAWMLLRPARNQRPTENQPTEGAGAAGSASLNAVRQDRTTG